MPAPLRQPGGAIQRNRPLCSGKQTRSWCDLSGQNTDIPVVEPQIVVVAADDYRPADTRLSRRSPGRRPWLRLDGTVHLQRPRVPRERGQHLELLECVKTRLPKRLPAPASNSCRIPPAPAQPDLHANPAAADRLPVHRLVPQRLVSITAFLRACQLSDTAQPAEAIAVPQRHHRVAERQAELRRRGNRFGSPAQPPAKPG